MRSPSNDTAFRTLSCRRLCRLSGCQLRCLGGILAILTGHTDIAMERVEGIEPFYAKRGRLAANLMLTRETVDTDGRR